MWNIVNTDVREAIETDISIEVDYFFQTLEQVRIEQLEFLFVFYACVYLIKAYKRKVEKVCL